MFAKVFVLAICFAVISANPVDSSVEEMRTLCGNDDTIACIKYKFMSFLDTIFKKGSFKQFTDDVHVVNNGYRANEISGARGETSFEENVQEYLQSHDVTFKLPLGKSSVTVGSRNLDENELNFKLKFSEATDDQEGRSSKLKKVMIPIMALVLVKAMTVIPFAIGIFGLKAWNAVQLGLIAFTVSVGLSIFQLCKKLAADQAHPQISAHGPWEAYRQRSLDEVAQPQVDDTDAQQMAYSAHY